MNTILINVFLLITIIPGLMMAYYDNKKGLMIFHSIAIGINISLIILTLVGRLI